MSSCPACHQQLDKDARFCGHCGHRLSAAGKGQAAAAQEVLPLVKRKPSKSQPAPPKAELLVADKPARPAPQNGSHLDPAKRETEEVVRESAERRAQPRLPLKVEVSFTSPHNFFTGFSQNANSGGLFVATYQPAAIGEVFEVSFTLPGVEQIYSALCQVRWMREYNPSSPEVEPGIGLKFVGLTREVAAGIERFFAQREPLFYDDEL